jgi:Uma2 family endonuclease
MSDPYQEILLGETVMRCPPGPRHELLCQRVHGLLAECLERLLTTRLLAIRAPIELAPGTVVRPDLTLVATATGKPWLIGEVIDSEDHHTDTVLKKTAYEESKLPRLWMIDPRYNNVEIYHGTPYGLSLKHILAQRDHLTEKLIPELHLAIPDLFAAGDGEN